MDAATLFIVILIATIFGVDGVHRWWHRNRWKPHRRDDD